MEFKSPIAWVADWSNQIPQKIYLSQPIGDQIVEYSWQRAYDEIARVANYLTRYPPGSHIAIYSLNCAHWMLTDLAIQMAGHVSIPIYPTASKATVCDILSHSESCLVFFGKMFETDVAIDNLPEDIDRIAIYQDRTDMPFWDDLVNLYEPLQQPVSVAPEDLVSIVYTSGTTGKPKGVMISYQAISSALELIKNIIVVDQNDRFVSYLPLAHIAERMAVEFASVFTGAQVSFIRSLDTFGADVKRAKPTIFFGVPRIWIKIKEGIESKLGGSDVVKKLFKIPIARKWLKKALIKKLGFEHVRYALCAAAAVNPDVLLWFKNLGLKLNEAYGMSETCGLSHMVKPDQECVGSVGQVIPGCRCRIGSNGEVLLQNPAMMSGYYKDDELTATTIDETGWLHTGDLGSIDSQGFLYITGRLKDLFKTSKGKYISPQPIEKAFQSELKVEHLALMGDGFRQPIMVVSTHETEAVKDNYSFLEICQQALNKLNPQLEQHEKISHVFVTDEPWSIDNGLLTPTMKMKRLEIERHYQSQVLNLVKQSEEPIIQLKRA